MDRGVTAAWGMAPIGTLTLGDRDHPVPPLTLGRFQRLLEMDAPPIIAALVGEYEGRAPLSVRFFRRALKWAILRAPWAKRPLWWAVEAFGVGKGLLRAPAAAPLVALAVPTVSPAEWLAHGSLREVMRLILLFANAHDWRYIGDAISFGEPLNPGEVIPTEADVTAGLLAVAKESGYTIEGLMEMRVEGFYRLTDALRRRPEPAAGEDRIPPGMAVEDQLPQGLMDLLDKAKEAGRGE